MGPRVVPGVADRETGTVRQCDDLCDTCIFRPGNLMHLAPGRVHQLVQAAVENEGDIVCHATLDTPEPAICAGFARHPLGAARSLALRMIRVGAATLQLITPPAKDRP
ncbi:hypothetical protein ACFZC3_15375 [Streptomyces sp. NPDC007903]|uniref:hypothetical protein n=1 Tax=Streptomyces sp. NPDC007903 TaxID=3364786 RepID=UPI0036E9A93C